MKGKLRENNADIDKLLINSINAIAFEFGIRKPVDSLLKSKIIEALTDSFGDFTVQEIKHCAYLYSTITLDYDKEHFQELSVRFLSGALISYRKKRNKALSKVLKESERLQREEDNKDVKEPKEDATFTITRYKIGSAYNKSLENNKPVDIDENYSLIMAKYMMASGVLKPSKEFTIKYRKLGYESLLKGFKSNEKLSVTFDKMNKNKEIYDKTELEFKELIRKRSAKIFIDEWLTEKAKSKIEFNTFFNKA